MMNRDSVRTILRTMGPTLNGCEKVCERENICGLGVVSGGKPLVLFTISL